MTTEAPTKTTLDEIYVEAIAESLDYYARAAEATRDRAAKEVAKYAARIAKGEDGSRHLGSTTDEYEISRQLANAIRDHAKFLATGERPEKDPASPAERIASSRRWINQELDRALDAIAGAWSSLSDTHVRAGVSLVIAIRQAELDGYDAAVAAATDDEGAEQARLLTLAKQKLKDAKAALDRARKPGRVAELEAEIETATAAAAHFSANVDLYREGAKKSVDRAIGSRLYPRGR